SASGVFSKQPAVFKFSVLPPFWKTWWFFLVVILMITSAIYFLIRLRTIRLHRNKQVLEELVSERTKELSEEKSKKDILLKEIHHRVKNNLQVINSLISLQSNYIEDEKALALFVECKDRIKSMALIHEKMYESTDLSNINLRDYITALANDLISTYGTNKFISLDLDISVDTLDVDTISPLGLLLSEILSNSLKHAFIGTDRGKIFIQFEQTEGSKYKLVIGDNGIGMSGDKMPEQSRSLGMELIKSFVEQLDGTIERVRRPGTVYRIVFETGEKA
ncbi:MAG: sensor histidine kinase, partial [Flavobacteriales bacterium]